MLIWVWTSKKVMFSLVYKKDYALNPSTCSCQYVQYLETIINDLVVACDEIIDPLRPEPTKTLQIIFKHRRGTCKMKNFYILLAFSLINILLLITVGSFYYYQHVKHRSKQKKILLCCHNNNKWKNWY